MNTAPPKNTGRLLGITLFVVMSLLYFVSRQLLNIPLSQLPKGMIGIATLYDVSVGARIQSFYGLILLGMGLFFIIDYGLSKYYNTLQTHRNRRHQLLLLNIGCMWGCLLWASTFVFGTPQYAALGLLGAAVAGWLAIGLTTRLPYPFTQDIFGALCTTIGFVVVMSRCAGNFYWKIGIGLVPFVVYGVQYFLGAKNTTSPISGTPNNAQKTTNIRQLSAHLITTALALFAGVELSFILASHHKTVPVVLSMLFSAVVGNVMLAFLWYKKCRIFLPENIYRHFIFPAVIVFVTIGTHYLPLITASEDTFELANPANAQMRWFKFGELPLLAAFSSHLLSEQVWGWLYIALNGYSGQTDFMAYYFLPQVFYGIIVYYFLNTLFKRPYFSFLTLLFFPFLHAVFPLIYCWSLPALMLLLRWQKQPEKPTWAVAALIYSLFLFLWRLDVAIPNAIAVAVVVLPIALASATKPYKILTAIGTRLGIIVGVLLGGLPAIVRVLGIPLWDNLRQAADYIGAGQAHAYEVLAHHYDRYFYAHYIFFPFLAAAIVLFLLRYLGSKTNTFCLSLSQKQGYILLFLSVFYLFNIQRGLVRHSLYENFDTFLSSYLYVWLPLALTMGFKIPQNRRPIAFLLTAFLVAGNFKYPDASEYSCKIEKCYQNDLPALQAGPLSDGRRIIETDKLLPYYADFKKFMDNNFSKNATFLDFSNTPMLYFYLQRPVPSYFNQYLQNTVTDNLQKSNLAYLQKFDVPVVLFANYPETWWDATDQVPNTLRYRYLSRYIFQNYAPLTQIGKHQVWLKKGLPAPNDLPPLDTALLQKSRLFNLGRLPALLAGEISEADTRNAHLLPIIADTIALPNEADIYTNGNLLCLQINTSPEAAADTLKVEYGHTGTPPNGGFTFITRPGRHTYALPMSSQYNWWQPDTARKVFFVRKNPALQTIENAILLKSYPFD